MRHCGVVGLLCVMELLSEARELEWALALFVKLLHSTAAVDDWYILAPLLVGACKAAAILGMSRCSKHVGAITRALKDALRSPHSAMRHAAYSGLILLADGGMETVYKGLLPHILHQVVACAKHHGGRNPSSSVAGGGAATATATSTATAGSSAWPLAASDGQPHRWVAHGGSLDAGADATQRQLAGGGGGRFVESRLHMLAWSLAEALIINCSATRVTFATDMLEAAFQQLCVVDGVPEVCWHVLLVLNRIMAAGVLSEAQVQLIDVIVSLSPRDMRTRLALISVSLTRMYASHVVDQSAPKSLFFQLRKAPPHDAAVLVQLLPAVLMRFLPREARCLLVLSELFSEATQPAPRSRLMLSISQVLSAPGLIELKKRRKPATAAPAHDDCADTVLLIAKFVATTIVRACQEQRTCASPLQALLCLFLALSPSPHLRALLHGLDLDEHVPPHKALLAFAGAEFLLQECMFDATLAEVCSPCHSPSLHPLSCCFGQLRTTFQHSLHEANLKQYGHRGAMCNTMIRPGNAPPPYLVPANMLLVLSILS